MAWLFDGTNDYLKTDTAPLDVSNEPLTIVAWVKFVANSGNDFFLSLCLQGSVNNNRHSLGYTGTGLLAQSRASVGVSATAAISNSTTEWNHLGGEFPSTTSRFARVNGVRGSEEGTTEAPAAQNQIVVGSRADTTSQASNLLIGEVGIYRGLLSDHDWFRLGVLRQAPPMVRSDLLVWYRSYRFANPDQNPPGHSIYSDWWANQTTTVVGSPALGEQVPYIIYPRSRISILAPQAGAVAVGHDYLSAMIRKRSIHPLIRM